MTKVFPGMDPYLEDPHRWPEVHTRLIVAIADALMAQVRPRYVASIDERVFIEGLDDAPNTMVPWVASSRGSPGGVATAEAQIDAPVVVRELPGLVLERSVAVRDLHDGQRVVAVIEVVRPSNKRYSASQLSYINMQREILSSDAHLIEIDLLRDGSHVVGVSEYHARKGRQYDYLVCVNRARPVRDTFDLYPRRLPERLPRVPVPLAKGDPDAMLDVQAVLDQVYEAGRYRERIDYGRSCVPPLEGDDLAWADGLIANL
jgi:hypothetical protein